MDRDAEHDVAPLPGDDGAEDARRRHRALADPSRARILEELAESGPLDTQELAGRIGLHPNTIRSHLVVLVDARLVSAEKGAPRGRGRPRTTYRVTASAPGPVERRYRLLAEILTSLVARSGGDSAEQLVGIGEAWGRHLVDSPPPHAALSDAAALDRLLALLAEVGFAPQLESDGQETRIRMRPCPFLELARRHEDVVCPIHLGLMRGALAELGAATTARALEPFVRRDLCLAHLTPAVAG